jgi:hypothetical protein
MGYRDITSFDHDPELATALGNMVAAWAYAESTLCCVLARVSGMNINMAIMGFYRIPTFESRRKFIQALLVEWQKPGKYDKEAIVKEVDAISDLSGTRNDWVHGVWCINTDKPSESAIFDFRKLENKGRRKEVKAPDVRNHVAAVVARSKRLSALIDRANLIADAE